MDQKRAIFVAFLINTLFVGVEFYAAIESGSLTLLADAVHMATDSISLALALTAAFLSAKAADKARTFGYQRLEVIGGLFNSIFLFVTLGYILIESYSRLITETPPVDGPILILVGFVGLLVNLGAARVLHDHNHSLNIRSAYLHLLADALGSIGAIAAGILVVFTNAAIIDVVFAVIIAILIGYSAVGVLRESFNILLQGTPSHVDTDELLQTLESFEEVIDIHHIHIWSLNNETQAMTAHIVITESADVQDSLEKFTMCIHDFGIDHPTIQIEKTAFDENHDCYHFDILSS